MLPKRKRRDVPLVALIASIPSVERCRIPCGESSRGRVFPGCSCILISTYASGEITRVVRSLFPMVCGDLYRSVVPKLPGLSQ